MKHKGKIWIALLAVAILIAAFSMTLTACSFGKSDEQEYEEPFSGFKFYKLENGTYGIKEYSGDAIDVVIPNSYNNKAVTSIGEKAFAKIFGLTSITIPDSVTSIGYKAFDGCTNITTATMPALAIDYIPQDSLTTVTITSGQIGSWAFEDCISLQVANLGDNVTGIGYDAFQNCTGLQKITIPAGVAKIGWGAFYNCTGLTEVNYLGTIKQWCEIEFDTYANPLSNGNAKLYLNDVEVTEIKDDDLDGVTSIPQYAFCGCMLTSVIIPDSVTNIGDYAFQGCTELLSVHIADDVQNIGYKAFDGCTGIRDATMPASAISSIPIERLTSVTISSGNIGGAAFDDCTRLRTITLGKGVTSIGWMAFNGCTNLTEVNYLGDIKGWCNIEFGYIANPLCNGKAKLYIDDVELTGDVEIPDGTTTIGDYTFYNCKGISSVKIPKSVTSIGDCAFYGCTNIVTATMPAFAIDYIPQDNLTTVTITSGSIDSYSFNDSIKLRNVIICEGVTGIGNYAFDDCIWLTEIVIPASVTSIGWAAFSGCDNLNSVTFVDPSGWYCVGWIDSTKRVDLMESDLQNKSTAATYLVSTYYSYTWYRVD